MCLVSLCSLPARLLLFGAPGGRQVEGKEARGGGRGRDARREGCTGAAWSPGNAARHQVQHPGGSAAGAAPPSAQDQLRTALAMGADRGIHVLTDANLEPLAVAKLLAALARREQPALCLLGKQAIDGDNNHTGALPRPLCACQRPRTDTLHAEGVSGKPLP